ncbi:hypothetical protein B0T10DRAFT_587331 [Thelonectria olida]|uniref:Protein kinase domain-containing protein n=1 Tax=Thelonectria olida TaxID=1576542 RepID=A0A9P9AR24_9HYPO|nr:hypothetical protein B0T10DRAFT_587331 [Thelonectria olida]
MAQTDVAASEPPPVQTPTFSGPQAFLRKLFRQKIGGSAPTPVEHLSNTQQAAGPPDTEKEKDGLIRRMSRRVVPGLPRAQTFKRQQSEQRVNLAPVEPTSDERRAVSVDLRSHEPRTSSTSQPLTDPGTSAPGVLGSPQDDVPIHVPPASPLPEIPVENILAEAPLEQVASAVDEAAFINEPAIQDNLSNADAHSMTTSQYDAMISDELERIWILNLSMHFRDRSKREKFFVTYREREHIWRRVTISLDYRNAPPNSLEMDLIHTHYQREKSAKIYEAIRESLRDIQFYDTVTNLKLQTTDGRLHVHVVEDGNEIIQYPAVSQIKHLNCRRIRERDIAFDSHMSGFVYKVHVNGQILIKKEIPSPETIDEFLYEVNALNSLRYSRNVIRFHGVVVDDHDEYVKGLLISYAEQGALIDLIYETCKDGEYGIPWETREKWARQIVEGLSDIHESGFVQGDFTLSNIVIDENNDAKIIDINRRGCPVGWEPPEATPLIECNQRITLYIGVKSDLYQLGMVLWALATQEDEPEAQGRPLILGPEVNIPDWYRQMAEICLSDDPRTRLQAQQLLGMFPPPSNHRDRGRLNPPPMSVDEDYTLNQYLGNDYPELQPVIRTVEQPSEWSYVSRPHAEPSPAGYEPYYYTRGRSPPSPLPSNYDRCDSPSRMYEMPAWAANRDIPSSYSDVGHDDMSLDETPLANKTALIESVPTFVPTFVPDAAPVEEGENWVLSNDTKDSAQNTACKVERYEDSRGTSNTVPTPIQSREAKLEKTHGVEYITSEPGADTITTQSAKVTGEEYTAVTKTASGPGEAEKDYTSIRVDSACDVVMPPETALVNQPEDVKRVHATRQNATKMVNDISREHVLEQPIDLKREISGKQRTNAEPDLKAPEAKGPTVPEPREPVRELSSGTVTPSKAHESKGEKGRTAFFDEHCELKGEGRMDSKEDRASHKTETTLVYDPDSLTGIGAAHLTNHDGDAIRHKTTIDEDLNAVESESRDALRRTDMKPPTQTI